MVAVDNGKCAVALHRKCEVAELGSLLEDMSRYYGFTVVAMPARTPKAKNNVEASVHYSYIDILAPLRNLRFHSLGSLNTALWEQMDLFNDTPFSERKEWTRRSLFMAEERGLLRSLPDIPYEVRQTVPAKVRCNSHVKCALDGYHYSVDHHYIGERVSIKLGSKDVQIWSADGQLLCTHRRGSDPYDRYVTDMRHMPEHLAEQMTRDESQLLYLASLSGPHTREVVLRFFDHARQANEAPEKYYETASGIVHLHRRRRHGVEAGRALLEQACGELCAEIPEHRALVRYGCVKRRIDAILERKAEAVPQDSDLETNWGCGL